MKVLITDTTMRDGHQSLLATRMRSIDMIRVAPTYAANLGGLFQRRVLGRGNLRRGLSLLAGMPLAAPARPARGPAQRDDPDAAARLERGGLHELSDNVVRTFVAQAAKSGVDVFRVFDSLNWVEKHARCDGRGDRGQQGLRGGDLLYGRPARSGAVEVRPEVLCQHGQGPEGRGRACAGAEGHGGAAQACLGPHPRQGAEGRGRPADPLPHA